MSKAESDDWTPWLPHFDSLNLVRPFTAGLPERSSDAPIVPKSGVGEAADFADVVVSLVDGWDGIGDATPYLKDCIVDWLRRSDEGPSELSVLDVVEVCLDFTIDYGEMVRTGEIIGRWCGEDVIAPASGTVAFLARPPDRYCDRGALMEIEAELGPMNADGFPDANRLMDDQGLSSFRSAAVHHGWTWTIAVIAVNRDVSTVPRARPEMVLIRNPRDAEEAAARWMRYWGWHDARTTATGADEGIDVVSRFAVGQVKAQMSPVGRPDVQRLFGAASAERKSALFFALSDYTSEAQAWADKAGVGLFRFDLQGQPEPINAHARRMIREQQTHPDA